MRTRIASKRLAAGTVASLFTLATLAASLAYLAPTAYAAFSGSGAGTSGDPYMITTCAELQEIEDELDAHYTLANDIDCTGADFVPITAFAGTLDGGGHTISNPEFDSDLAYSDKGLFATIESGGVVENVGLTDVDTEFTVAAGGLSAGMVAGTLNGGATIRNVYVTGEIICTDSILADLQIGGLVGTSNGTIQNSYSAVDITCSTANGGATVNAGGIVGDNPGGTIINVFSTGDVSVTGPAAASVGGLIGNNASTDNENSYSVMEGPAVGSGSGLGTTSEILLSSLYSASYLVYIGTPAWDFDDIWQFLDSSSLPVLRPAEDNDGIAAAVEDAAPNNGDANNDNIPDSQQPYVASFVNPLTGKYVALETTDDCAITAVSMQSEATDGKDSGFDYPFGLMNFTLVCDTPGFTATVGQYYFDTLPDGFTLRKYVPDTNAYFNVPDAAMTAGPFLGQDTIIITYLIEDNGPLDLDDTPATITDPVGLAASAVGAPNTGLGGRLR